MNEACRIKLFECSGRSEKEPVNLPFTVICPKVQQHWCSLCSTFFISWEYLQQVWAPGCSRWLPVVISYTCTDGQISQPGCGIFSHQIYLWYFLANQNGTESFLQPPGSNARKKQRDAGWEQVNTCLFKQNHKQTEKQTNTNVKSWTWKMGCEGRYHLQCECVIQWAKIMVFDTLNGITKAKIHRIKELCLHWVPAVRVSVWMKYLLCMFPTILMICSSNILHNSGRWITGLLSLSLGWLMAGFKSRIWE